jgi:IS605 OrfB family transposase
VRRVRQAQHETAKEVITWAVDNRIGALAVGNPRGVLHLKAGRRHSQRTRDWRVGHLIRALFDKAEAAGITVRLVDERGTSSTCPHCGQAGHRDLVAAASIAARGPGSGTIPRRPSRAGDHAPSRRSPSPWCAPRAA